MSFFFVCSSFVFLYFVVVVLAGPKIQNGTAAELGEFPFVVQVRMFLDDKPRKRYNCSGFIIGEKWVITAAHCTTNFDRFEVQAGTVQGGDDNGQLMKVRKVHSHPFYWPGVVDIALLELSKELEWNRNVQPVVRASQVGLEVTSTTRLFVVGFGTDAFVEDTTPDRLEWTANDPIFLSSCSFPFPQECSVFCTKSRGKQVPCYGDSGGPLLVLDQKYGWIVVGFVLGGTGCDGEKGDKNGFTKLSAFESFINCVVAENKVEKCNCRCDEVCTAEIPDGSKKLKFSSIKSTLSTITNTVTNTVTTSRSNTPMNVTATISSCSKSQKFKQMCEGVGGEFSCVVADMRAKINCESSQGFFTSFSNSVPFNCESTKKLRKQVKWCQKLEGVGECQDNTLTCQAA